MNKITNHVGPLTICCLILIMIGVFLPGCTENPDLITSINNPAGDNSPTTSELVEIPPEPFSPTTSTISEPTQAKSNISDWDPYKVLPAWEPPLNHSSINRDLTQHNIRQSLNTTYSGTVSLAGFAIGKELIITNGPFSITYTVHPTISSPRDVWVRITIFDPWQQIISEGGYNRGFPNQETQSMIIYRTGRHYMSIEGEFASVDYNVKTTDIVPVETQTPISESDEMDLQEEEFI